MDEELASVLGLLFTGLMLTVITAVCASQCTNKSVRNEAVQNGAAEWVATEDGKVEFRWIKPDTQQDTPDED